MSSCPLYTG